MATLEFKRTRLIIVNDDDSSNCITSSKYGFCAGVKQFDIKVLIRFVLIVINDLNFNLEFVNSTFEVKNSFFGVIIFARNGSSISGSESNLEFSSRKLLSDSQFNVASRFDNGVFRRFETALLVSICGMDSLQLRPFLLDCLFVDMLDFIVNIFFRSHQTLSVFDLCNNVLVTNQLGHLFWSEVIHIVDIHLLQSLVQVSEVLMWCFFFNTGCLV
mmetsp:Transcript_52633/g.60214  ORF Transcript_52633/g.60214 Transcript_52633/m.60214 type:complete len:215 (-) Transcript_52633:974-1618(-)